MAAQFPTDFQTDAQNLWTSPLAPPIAYSEGNEAENYLTQVLNQTSDLGSASQELERRIVDWSSEYHLTPLRANLLRPFKFKDKSKILEVGAGCGAVTRYLGEQGHHVTALEGAYDRAKIARLRCKDLNNVEVLVADIWEVDFEEKYDVVTLIGVLEYAAKYGPDRNVTDFTRTIEWAKRYLKPNGILLIAIENKFGLKYFSGCPEDHSGRLFEGLEGYYRPDAVRTFGKKELSQLLDATGFHHYQFYLPFPDYKIPTVMVAGSEVYADQKTDFNLSAWCDMPFESYGSRRRFFVNDQLAIREFERNGLFDEIANSYLVFATTSSDFSSTPLEFDPGWVAKKINLNRGRPYQTITTLHKSEAPFVSKKKFWKAQIEAPKGVDFTLTEADHEPYLGNREKLSLELLRSSRHRDPTQLRFWNLMRDYHSYLLSLADEQGLLPPNCFDLLPFNVMINPDSTLAGFDFEWMFKERVPLKRVLFRGAMMFFSREKRWLKNLNERPMTSLAFARLVCAKLNVSLSTKEIGQFMRAEREFHGLVGSRASLARQSRRQVLLTYFSDNILRPMDMFRDGLELLIEMPDILRTRYFNKSHKVNTSERSLAPLIPTVPAARSKTAEPRKEVNGLVQKVRRLLLLDHLFLLENLVVRNLKVKYRRSFFGFFWTLLHPLFSSTIYFYAFKQVARLSIPNYSSFVVVSNIPWTFFSQSVVEAAEGMVNSRDLIRKIYCPREVFPMASVVTNFITLVLSMPVMAAFAYFGGGRITPALFALIPVAFLTLLFTHVLGLLLSVLYVFFRDVKHLIGILMQIMFFATPVVYEPQMVPEKMRFILYLNPMAAIIPAYRDILLKNTWPDWTALANAGFISIIVGMLAYNLFANYNKAIPEYV